MLHNPGPQRFTEDQGADTKKDQQSINPTLSPSSTQRGGVGLWLGTQWIALAGPRHSSTLISLQWRICVLGSSRVLLLLFPPRLCQSASAKGEPKDKTNKCQLMNYNQMVVKLYNFGAWKIKSLRNVSWITDNWPEKHIQERLGLLWVCKECHTTRVWWGRAGVGAGQRGTYFKSCQLGKESPASLGWLTQPTSRPSLLVVQPFTLFPQRAHFPPYHLKSHYFCDPNPLHQSSFVQPNRPNLRTFFKYWENICCLEISACTQI